MNATAWTAVAAIVAVVALGATLLAHIIKWAEEKGHMRARLESLERSRDEANDAGKLMAALDATVGGLSRAVEKLDHTVDSLLQGKIELPSRRRRVSGD